MLSRIVGETMLVRINRANDLAKRKREMLEDARKASEAAAREFDQVLQAAKDLGFEFDKSDDDGYEKYELVRPTHGWKEDG